MCQPHAERRLGIGLSSRRRRTLLSLARKIFVERRNASSGKQQQQRFLPLLLRGTLLVESMLIKQQKVQSTVCFMWRASVASREDACWNCEPRQHKDDSYDSNLAVALVAVHRGLLFVGLVPLYIYIRHRLPFSVCLSYDGDRHTQGNPVGKGAQGREERGGCVRSPLQTAVFLFFFLVG